MSSRPTSSTSPIAPKDIRACLPTRFTGKDADLVAAKAAFNVLNNPAASTTLDIGMDEGSRSLGGGGLLFLLQLHYCCRLAFSLIVFDNLDGGTQHRCL